MFLTEDSVSWHMEQDVLKGLDTAHKPSSHAKNCVVDQRKIDGFRAAKIAFLTSKCFVGRITSFKNCCFEFVFVKMKTMATFVAKCSFNNGQKSKKEE